MRNLPAITVFMLAVGTERAEICSVRMVVAGGRRLSLVALEAKRQRRRDDRPLMLSLPLVGDIWLKYHVANFSRMLSTLLTGGLPLVPSLETAGASMSSRQILNG